MQGRVEVSSAAGLGTRLRVWLPQGQTLQPLPEEAFAPTRSAFGDLEGVAGDQPLTVLYAEDNVVNIELVRQVMRMRPQWRLEVAYCGQDAITMALRDPPDLLLLDMHLGDMSGLDVSNVLTRQPHTAGIPRVALSADVLPDLVREARAQGFVDYLSKPLDVGRLLRLLDRVSQLKAQ
jgi:CheY-like chemotaxis protein